ncbi:MAG TPA: hypothetical protein VHE30_17825 [Polyangiaceae bacterium]|nr:hypothetical protein [Polyangiaceae bacterium]
MITDPCPPPDWSDEDEATSVRGVAVDERIAYVAAVVATLAVERVTTRDDIRRLRKLCTDLQIPESEIDALFAPLENPMNVPETIRLSQRSSGGVRRH